MTVDYLRISVTDRCNLRCVYCNPLGDCGFIAPNEILRYEEIYRLVRLFADRGIRKVRLTGGEPLVRKDIAHLTAKLSSIPGIEDLAMTTNGVLLKRTAAGLKAAGLNRVNISVDSVEKESYEQITGLDLLDDAVKGIDKAIAVGLKPVKINAVILKGINENQIIPLAGLARRLDVIVRFIEYFPTERNTRPGSEYIPNSRIRKTIESRFGPLMSLVGGKSAGPALYFKLAQSEGAIGFISGRSSMFCASCNRLRLTSDGKIRPCLYSAHSYDMKKLLRSGADDTQILETIDRIIDQKHKFTKTNSFTEEFSMRNIGG